MINSIIYKLKQDKFLLVLATALLAIALFDVAVIIYDIVNLVLTRSNPAKLASGFMTFNIVAASINLAGAIAVVIYMIFRKR